MTIHLKDLISLSDPAQFKLHLACRNEDGVEPLDEYVTAYENWVGWNKWKGNKNDWTREYIFSLISFYPKQDAWLFGGVFKVIDKSGPTYKLQEQDEYQKYVGRLILHFHRAQGMRGRAYYLETYLDNFKVIEILPSAYTGEAFPGYARVEHDFHVLEAIFKNQRNDWKTALSSVNGIYAICDRSNGKTYIGSASGTESIWGRWACYIGDGHGGNVKLRKLIKEKGIDYARVNFRFSILEIMEKANPSVIEREVHWKNALATREHGYNDN